MRTWPCPKTPGRLQNHFSRHPTKMVPSWTVSSGRAWTLDFITERLAEGRCFWSSSVGGWASPALLRPRRWQAAVPLGHQVPDHHPSREPRPHLRTLPQPAPPRLPALQPAHLLSPANPPLPAAPSTRPAEPCSFSNSTEYPFFPWCFI